MLADAFTDFMATHGGTILTGLGIGMAGIGSFIVLVVRTIWTRVEHYWEKRDKRDEALSYKQSTLIDTMTANAPQQTSLLAKIDETQRAIAVDIAESRKRDSDFIREVHQTKEAAVELSYGIEAMAVEDIEERRKELERYMGRARQRLGAAERKSRHE